jgi:two-component system sensor histidine kinase/response regulator
MSKFSILIVDDIEQNIHSLKFMIEDSFDVNIHSALSAQEGMEILMKEDVNLILSDIQMPEIDGFEFAEYVKGLDKTKDIPIIFITGIYDKNEYQQKGYDLGAVEYITKPIDDTLLSSKLKIYIDLFEGKKQTEDALEKTVVELNLKDEELSQKDEVLIHQAKMATMGEMIGVIAHQLKQPLNVLSLYCGDVTSAHKFGTIDDEFVEDFDKSTKEQIKFLSETIDGFRNFFNPDKKKVEFVIKEAIEHTVKLLGKQMEAHNINIDIDVDDEKVYGVFTEFEQVLLNLITNAKDAFIEKDIKGDRNIIIRSGSIQNKTLLTIEDNAGGIPNENLEKIFDPYFTTKKEGTGTGLYMVKLVIKSSFGGDLKIENSNKGVKFVILLNSQKS